jgi:hypothetical protein
MRMLPLAGLALTVVLVLSGCVPPKSLAMPTFMPSSTPVFASDEEALAAATVAYKDYQAAVDRALSDYDTSGLARVATGEALRLAKESVKGFQEKSLRQVGRATIDRISLARVSQSARGESAGDSTQIYACLDTAAVNVLDSTGRSTALGGRQTRFPVLVDLTLDSKGPELKVANEGVWDGGDFCN